jgi:hypothetical protein
VHAPRPRLLLIATMAVALVACGRKTDPKPPELVAPRAVSELALTTRADGVMIRWLRPTQYVDGSSMEDLAGFVIERSRNNEPFSELVRVPVTDRGMFQKVKRFEYVDTTVASGTTYHYRILAFTTDDYYSADSGVATIEWKPPTAVPSPAPSPRAGKRQEQ